MNQRDCYEVNFLFPDGRQLPHPVIVLSIPSVIDREDTFIGVPISHSAEWTSDEFSFPIDDEDFDRDLKYDESYVRMHLITVIPMSDLTDRGRLRTMKPETFKRLMKQINEMIFGNAF